MDTASERDGKEKSNLEVIHII